MSSSPLVGSLNTADSLLTLQKCARPRRQGPAKMCHFECQVQTDRRQTNRQTDQCFTTFRYGCCQPASKKWDTIWATIQ